MECLIAIGSAILGKIAESTVEPVGRLLGYLFYYRSNIENLTNKVGELDEMVTRLKEQVEEAEMNEKEIADAEQKDAVPLWLDESKKLSEEVRGMRHCSSCSMVSRYKSSKKAKEMKDLVVDKIQDGGRFSEVSFRSIIPNWIENKDYNAFETRMSIEDKIMEALRDSSVRTIGVNGMPGVGKTMLAKEIAKKSKRERLFDKVAIVAVSQTPDVKEIQKGIAEQLELELKLDGTTQGKGADRLKNELSEEHKVLIVLDDIWDELELGNVGIHFGDDQKGCKLLFTSRSQDVLSNLMGVDKNFRIEPLSSSEAMNLFKKMVGVRAEQDDFKPLAVEVVEECGGLPIAIVTVAKALKNWGLSVWRDALTQLRNSSPTNIEGMSEKVYSSVKLSYDFLRNEEAKSLLLLCSLHEEDERIDPENLMRYGVGWGLFRDVDTLDAARDRVKSLLDKLKARCLLLDGSYEDDEDDNRVMMHDVIRDVGISIASEERRMVNFKTAFKLEECSSKGELKDKTAIFLRAHYARNVDNHIGKLECPELELFLSPKSTFLVPDQFFEETKKLRALDLSRGNLESPPSSFALQNLVTLRLSGCMLGDVTFIGELKNLEILDLSQSNVMKLPRQIEKLTRLRLLDLRYCGDLKVIEANVISNLKQLEELYMYGGFTQWEVEGVSNTSLSEIKNLSRLTILSLKIPDASVLPKDLFPGKLEKFNISIGSERCLHTSGQPRGINSPNFFCLKLMNSNRLAERERGILMQKSVELHLEGFEDLNIISVNELERRGFPRLKNFYLSQFGGMKYIVNSEGHNRPCSVFPNLERLELYKLEMLEKICYGKLAEESFGKLSVLDVWACGRLKNVVQFSIAKRLEDIRVFGCGMIKEIVFQSEDENEAQLIPEVEFPRLRRLELNSLPELVQFFWSHLETGTSVSSMLDCAMTPLFSEKVVFPSLIDLTLHELNIKKLWPDQLPTTSSSMQNLEKLKVDKCHSLEYLLSSTMAKGCSIAKRLEDITVSDCKMIKEIVFQSEDENEVEFPRLRRLKLKSLPELVQFFWSHLETGTSVSSMLDCPMTPLFSEKRCGTLLPSFSSFKNLKTLSVTECPRVINLLASSTVRGLVHLSTMSIIKCKQVTEIITTSEEDETECEIVFRELKSLVLDDLPSLRRFYSGNTSITFPKLEKLILRRCPELQSFSRGTINSSKLTSIQIDYKKVKGLLRVFKKYEEAKPEELVWEGDINTTVLKLYENDSNTSI